MLGTHVLKDFDPLCMEAAPDASGTVVLDDAVATARV